MGNVIRSISTLGQGQVHTDGLYRLACGIVSHGTIALQSLGAFGWNLGPGGDRGAGDGQGGAIAWGEAEANGIE